MKVLKSKKVFLITGVCLVAGALAFLLINLLTNNNKEVSSKNHFYKVYSDNFTVDADIPASYNDKADILNAKIMQFDDDVISSVFFKGTGFEKLPDEGNVIYYPTKKLKKDPKSTLPNLTVSADGSALHYSSEELGYIEFATFAFRSNYEYTPDMTKFSDTFKEDSLSFMSKEDALAAVSAEMKKLNVDVPKDAEIYALDHKSLESYWDKNKSKLSGMFPLKKDAASTFTQKHELYAVRFRLSFDGVPLTYDNYFINKTDSSVTGSDISVFYSEDGIIGIYWWGLYDIQDVAESPKNIITPKEAFDKAFKSHKAKKDGNKITVTEARFEYSIIPDSKNSKEFKLVPSWVLVYSGNLKGEEITTTVHINAVTGDVIDGFQM